MIFYYSRAASSLRLLFVAFLVGKTVFCILFANQATKAIFVGFLVGKTILCEEKSKGRYSVTFFCIDLLTCIIRTSYFYITKGNRRQVVANGMTRLLHNWDPICRKFILSQYAYYANSIHTYFQDVVSPCNKVHFLPKKVPTPKKSYYMRQFIS